MSVKKKIDKRLSLKLIRFYRENPIIAAQELLVRNGKPVRLMPPQQRVIRDWWHSNFGICTASRGFGKTFTAAVFIALKAMLYPGIKIGIIAPTFRQSQLTFDEFRQFHDDSPLLAAEIAKPPIKQTDKCLCVFKTRRGYRASIIMALPLGNDGKKIRGNRFNIIMIDECVHVPENVFSAAIQPMLSTSLDPVESVEIYEKIAAGELDPSTIEGSSSNGYFAYTSGYYKFNYWWNEIENFANEIQKARQTNTKTRYCLHFIPWHHMPKGFFQEHVVENSRANNPEHIFRTEWLAQWLDDSAGAFKMSLLKSCQDLGCIPKRRGDRDKEYIVGIDPARNNDASALVVIEVGNPCKLVNIIELIDVPWPEQAKRHLKTMSNYNVKAIYMDSQGGGKTLADSFADKNVCRQVNVDPIVEVDVEPGKAAGARRILYMVNPSSQTNADVNDAALKVLEERWLVMPPSFAEHEKPMKKALDEDGNPKTELISYEILGKRKGTKKDKEGNVKLDTINLVEELINQMASIVVTETKTGRLHYDLPKRKGTAGSEILDALHDYKKDLYSAFILASKGVYDLEYVPRYDTVKLAKGIIREIGSKEPINMTHRGMTNHTSSNNSSSNAVKKSVTKDGGIKTTFPYGVVIGKSRTHGPKRRK